MPDIQIYADLYLLYVFLQILYSSKLIECYIYRKNKKRAYITAIDTNVSSISMQCKYRI